ncbi:MAG: metallophosphoesterase [Candidatus Eisenbacteria sp.]|nr:metallophosphoesterase [Candidatus Eisenbacteria bacterium]
MCRVMVVATMCVILVALPAGSGAWTPQTIQVDGANDFLPENLLDPDGYDTEFSQIDIDSVFVTNDGNNLYIGIQYYEDAWSNCCVGIAIDLGDAYGGLTDPWARQIEWSEAPNPPNFISYVNLDNNWQDLRRWTGSSWVVVCAGDGGCGHATGTGFKEFTFSLATLGVTVGETVHLELWTTQQNTKGALDLVASDSRQESTPEGTNWSPSVPTKPDQYLPFVVMNMPDLVPPVLQVAEHIADYQMRLTFSEAVDAATGQSAANYTVEDAGVDSARVDLVNPALVCLYIDQDFSAGENCRSVTVTGVEDLAGNPIVENGTDNVAYFFVKGVLFRGNMAYYLSGMLPGTSVSFSLEGVPYPLTWELCDNFTGDVGADSIFNAYVEFSLSCEGPSGPTVEETARFKFVHQCGIYEPMPENRTHVLTSATGPIDTLDLWWNNVGPRRRGPYLSWQGDPASTMTVSWQTMGRGTSRVEYGPDESYGYAAGDSTPEEWHTVELTALDAGGAYHYQASSSTGFLSDDTVFRTGLAGGGAFTFLVYGDTRTDSSAHQTVVDRMETEDALLLLHTGDLVEHGSNLAEWNTFFDITADLISRMPLMPAIGNHEDNNALYYDFFALPNATPPASEQWYSFDVGSAHFVALSTETDYSVGSSQYDWLVSDLAAAATSDWVFVYFHRPPFSSGSHGSDLTVRSTLCPVFETYGVDVVFSGHDHLYERSLYNGITYIVAAGGGAPLYNPNQNPNPYQVYAEATYHYCRLSVTPTTCLVEAVKPDGTIFDSILLDLTGVAENTESRRSRATGFAGVFPNPSAAGVEIRYSLARDVAASIAVYDVRGREIKTVGTTTGDLQGAHTAYWDRTDHLGNVVSPGVYFIRLSTDRVSETRKVVLVE